MSLINEISTLKDLGLTHNQARVYLTLVELGPSKAEEISKSSEVTRQDIYRIIPSLQLMGIVETILGRPKIFKALSLKETLSMLFSQREKETDELKKHTSILLKNHRNKNSEKSDEDIQTIYIPGKIALLKRTQNAVKKAKKSMYSISSWNNVMEHRSRFYKNPEFKEMIKKNIKICFVTDKPKQKEIPLHIFSSSKFSNFKIRFSKDSPKAHLLIIDNKEVFIRLSEKSSFSESSSIWSNNPCIVTIAQSYFEKMWNESVNPDDNRNIQVDE